MRELKKELDKVVDKILSYKPEKHKKEDHRNTCDCIIPEAKEVKYDSGKNG